MADLNSLIENMPEPKLSDFFNDKDQSELLLIIASAKEQARSYDGGYKAKWLLSDFNDLEWVTANRGREEYINGEWENAIKVNWNLVLPNGKLLSDAEYCQLLELNRRIAFLIRSGYVGEISAPIAWRSTVATLLQITRWVVLHEGQFQPSKFGFKLFDQNALESLFFAIAEGGWTVALQVPHRILGQLYKSAFNENCPQCLYEAVYELPVFVKNKIVEWLSANGFYGRVHVGTNAGKRYLKRDRLAQLIFEPLAAILHSQRLSAFCRQFELDLDSSDLLINVAQITEMPSQKIIFKRDVISTGATESTLDVESRKLACVFSAYRHCSNFLPDPAEMSVEDAHKLALKFCSASGHTLFMPINVGLHYLNHAMRIVVTYGEAVVDYYLAMGPKRPNCNRDFTTIEELNSICSSLAGEFLVRVNGVNMPVAEALGIVGFQRLGQINFDMLRNRPTLGEMLRVVIGACIICIALLKPSREDELTHLKRECVSFDKNGFKLHFSLGKSNTGAAYQNAEKPIPLISGRAIRLLQKLGSGLVNIFKDKRKISRNLFYVPKLFGCGAMKTNSQIFAVHLDIFCDYVALPTDDLGRRWYVRVHEMRKWFLLLLFWSGRFDVLDAARWIAGHRDVKHIYAYIEREFPGEELPSLEAEYAISRLRTIDSFADKRNSEVGLDALYEKVLQHFNIEALSMVPEREWMDYVSSLRDADGFILEPHTVYANNGLEIVGINVSFILREIAR